MAVCFQKDFFGVLLSSSSTVRSRILVGEIGRCSTFSWMALMSITVVMPNVFQAPGLIGIWAHVLHMFAVFDIDNTKCDTNQQEDRDTSLNETHNDGH